MPREPKIRRPRPASCRFCRAIVEAREVEPLGTIPHTPYYSDREGMRRDLERAAGQGGGPPPARQCFPPGEPGPHFCSPEEAWRARGRWAALNPAYPWRLPRRYCRDCGCTDEHGCAGGCHWVEWDLCSKCVH